jgi:phosphohistidine phosphatase SixA
VITHVYSTDYSRTLETATPVATLKNILIKYYDPRNLAEFSTKIKTLEHVLVVGHSNTTPQILSLMGGEYINIEESDYGVVYKLQKHDFGHATLSISIPLE